MKRTLLLFLTAALLSALVGCRTPDEKLPPVVTEGATEAVHATEAETVSEVENETETEVVAEPQTEAQTESKTEPQTEPETVPTEADTIPFTPPDGMTLLGEVAKEPPSLVVNEMNANNDDIGSSGSLDSSNEDMGISDQWVKPELVGTEATLTHFGFEAKGTYRSSYSTPYYNETVDIYDGVTESGAKYSFSLSSNTGKLKTFLYPFTPDTLVDGYRPAVLPDIDKPALTKEECTQIAKDLLYNGMEAVGTYKGYVSYMKTNSVVDGYYEFRFTRWIGDVETAEFVLIQVTSRGRILYVYSDQFKAFDHVDSLDYDEKEVTAAFEYKLANLYKNDLQDKSLYYKTDTPVLTRLSDGKIYLKYPLDVQIYTSEGKLFAHDRTNLLVCIS